MKTVNMLKEERDKIYNNIVNDNRNGANREERKVKS